MIEIIDNAISTEKQNTIQRIVESYDFKWTCVDTIEYSSEYLSKYKPNKKQFEHHLIIHGKKTSDYSSYIFDTLNLSELGEYKVLKAKVNLNTPYKEKNFITPHTDANIDKAKSIIYYANDSDGKTIIYNNIKSSNQNPHFWWKKTKVNPKKGRMVKFPSNILHSGNVPNLFDARIVINIILIPSSYEIVV